MATGAVATDVKGNDAGGIGPAQISSFRADNVNKEGVIAAIFTWLKSEKHV